MIFRNSFGTFFILVLWTACFVGCSFDMSVVPALTADQVLRKVSVTSGLEMTLEEGQEYDISLQVHVPDIPNLHSKPTTLSWSIDDPDGDFEQSSGEINIPSLDDTNFTFTIKPKKDAIIEQDEHFYLFFSGGPFQDLSENRITLIVIDKTTPAKVETSLANVDFGVHLITDSNDRTVIFTNTGDATAENIVWSNPTSPFSYKGNAFPGLGGTCGSILEGGASCTMILSYSSNTAASHSEILTWNYKTPVTTANDNVNMVGLSVEVTAILGGLPNSRSNSSALNVSVSGIDVTHYKFKVGPTSSTNCAVASGYSADFAISQRITNSLSSWANQNLRVCVVGQESHGIWQPYSQATSYDWFYDDIAPSVTLEQKITQTDPARTLPIEFSVVFSEAISGFTIDDIEQNGSASGITWNLTTSDNVSWNLQATAITGNGTLIPSISEGAVTDLAGNANSASVSTDNSVLYDSIVPTLTINQRAGQADPTNSLPIHFTIVFSEPIEASSFTTSSITQLGTATPVAWTLSTADNKTWTLSALTAGEGTLVPVVGAGKAQDAAGNLNLASTSTDNSVTYSTSAPNNASSLAWQQTSPTNTTALVAEWTKSASTLSAQRFTLYSGDNCDTQITAPTTIGSSDQSRSITGTQGTTYTYKITSVDLATNSVESSCSAPLRVDTTAPTISNVTSTKANGAYKAGSVIDIQITFSETVYVTGTPVLALNTTPARSASYASGSGTSTLTFNYTVQAGDESSDLNYGATTALTAASASIQDEAGNSSPLTLPGLAAAGSLGTNKNIVIDTTAPTIDIFSVTNTNPTNSTTYNLSRSVSGSPTEYCILENSSTVSSCSWTSGNNLPASFVVSATNNSKTLYAWVRDAAGNVSAMSTSNAVILDTFPPTINLAGAPTGTSAKYNLTITPSGTDIVSYSYKMGPTSTTVCSSSTGYSAETLIATPIVQNISSIANGGMTVCAIGKDTAGNWQAYASATTKSWTKSTPTLQFTLTSSSTTEYDSPSHTVEVSIPAAVDINVSAAFNFSAGPTFPATNGVDYTGTSGTVTILAGNTTATIIIPIIDDLRYENNETFYVNLSSSTGATLGSQAQHLVTILDDDDPPLISIQDVYVIEGASTSLRASLSASSDKGNVTIGWTLDTCTGSDCASSPEHYSMPATSGTAVIPQGSSFVDFGSVITVDNSIDEPHRRIPIKITSVTGGTLLAGKADVIINDNDYPAGKDVVKIATNSETTCASTSDEKVYCWGKNQYGQLAQNDRENRNSTVEVVVGPTGSPKSIVDIQGISNRFCALTTLGELYCWGYGGGSTSGTGLIGDGSTATRYTPTYVSGLGTGISQFSMSGYNTCAIKNGAVYCWGSNYNGIGGAVRTDPPVVQKTPIAMPAPLDQNVTKISMGIYHACVIISGEVYCWGNNNNGELGRGNTNGGSSPRTTPEKVLSLGSNIVDLWSGYYGSCAKNSDGEVFCWGRNTEKQLTNDTATLFSTPIRIPDFDNADHIEVQKTTCILRAGQVSCRGDNQYGSVGDNRAGGETVTALTTPLGAETNVTTISVGYSNSYTCFSRSGQIYCTGYAGYSNLGDGYQNAFHTPFIATNISGLGSPSKVSFGQYQACGLFSGAVKCWGWNNGYRSGNQSPEAVYTEPTPVKGLTAGYIDVVTAATGACALHSSGSLKCWGGVIVRGQGSGGSASGNPISPIGLDSGVTAVFAPPSQSMICAIKNNELYCWGANELGNVGTGGTSDQYTPKKIIGGEDVISVQFSSYSTCILKTDEKVYCVGDNRYGSMGVGDTTPRYTYTEVPGLSGIKQLSAGTGTFCVRHSNNTVSCWGRLVPGYFNTNRTTPTLVSSLTNTTEIYGSYENLCAKTEGIMKCWASNQYGQFGIGTAVDTNIDIPTATGFPSNYSGFYMSPYRICAKYGDDYLCAGLETYSEMTHNNKPQRLAPISVMPFPN